MLFGVVKQGFLKQNLLKQGVLKWLQRRSPRQRDIRLDNRQIYILPSRNGLIFLTMALCIFVGGLTYSNSLILAVAFLLISLFLVSILHTYANLVGLRVQAGRAENAIAGDIGFGRIGRLAEPLSRKAFIEHLCAFFNLPALRVAGQIPEEVNTVAVCGGSGSDLAEGAFAGGAQVYVTGEVKHSTARWAEASGFSIIDAGHFATENPVVESLVKRIADVFAEQGVNVPVQPSAKQQNPFAYYEPGT